jgi:hypothetical protein
MLQLLILVHIAFTDKKRALASSEAERSETQLRTTHNAIKNA